MDGYTGTDYLKGSFTGDLDKIKLKLLTRVLDISDILSECMEFDNLYVLSGVKNFIYRREYGMDDVEFLVNILSQNFDVVILDAGCNIESALCLGSLCATKNRYLITTPQSKSLTNFNIIYAVLDKLYLNSFSLITQVSQPSCWPEP